MILYKQQNLEVEGIRRGSWSETLNELIQAFSSSPSEGEAPVGGEKLLFCFVCHQ